MVRALIAAATLFLFIQVGFGQSLADIARKERQKKARESKPEKVYTNEDIPKQGEVTTSSAPGATTEKEKGKESDKEAAKTEGAQSKGEGESAKTDKQGAKPSQSPEEKQAELEKQYRDRFAKARDEVALQESKLDVMQRELNLLQQQYYSDPNVALREQTFRDDINRRTQAIDQQKAAVDKAKQAVSDLEEELRTKGLPPGWAR